MLWLYRFFCGILEVELSGVYPEKIFSFFVGNRITVWNSGFVNKKIRFFITVKDFLKLPKILKKSGIRVHILSKRGFPFFIKKYKRRFGIFTGVILFFIILQFMSGFIWDINVVGNVKVSDVEIISACNKLGIDIGTRQSRIDTKNTAQRLLLELDGLAWGSLNIEGCRLTVNVTEITQKAEDNSVATNLKAKSDGIIRKIDVTSGNCVVKVGDVVKKGDILVSGINEGVNNTQFVHSIGSIIAQTEQTVSFQEPFVKKVKYPTGKVKKKGVIELFCIKIPLYIGKTKGSYQTVKTDKAYKLFGKRLPIFLHTKEFVFIKNATLTRDYDEITEILEEKLLNAEKSQGFTVKSQELKSDREGVTLTAVISKSEDIAYSENIIFAIGN